MLQCVFYNNYGARNTIDYVNDDVVQSNVTIEQCSFENNSDYGVSIVELKLKSQSFISIDGLNFSNNAGTGAMIYINVHFNSIMISIKNIIIWGNYGSSVYRRGGFI